MSKSDRTFDLQAQLVDFAVRVMDVIEAMPEQAVTLPGSLFVPALHRLLTMVKLKVLNREMTSSTK